jgi:predicted dehydrogenase
MTMKRILLSLLVVSSVFAQNDLKPLRAGIIGLDTSHVPAFTKLFNKGETTGELAGIKVTTGYTGGTDMPASRDRKEKFTQQLRDMGVEIVPTIPELLAKVDVVLLESVDGRIHLQEAREIFKAGKPVFIDKPLTDNEPDLKTFVHWVEQGLPIMSSSSMRYTKEFMPYRHSTRDLGDLRFVSITTAKSWETYGIHALEAVYPILGPGFLTVRNTGTAARNVVHLTHRREVDVVVVASADMYGSFGVLQLCGTAGRVQTASSDSYYAFRAQLVTALPVGKP